MNAALWIRKEWKKAAFVALIAGGAAIYTWAIRPVRIDLGDMMLGESRPFELVITNPTKESWQVKDIKISCDCTTLDKPGSVIPAERAATFYGHLRSKAEGLNRIRIDMVTTAGVRRFEISARALIPVSKRLQEVPAAPKLVISATEVISRLGGTGKEVPILVDVRAKEAYDYAHIPGALPLSLWTVKFQPFLPEGRSAILVGSGVLGTQEREEVETMQKKGWDVRWLEGGLRSWVNARGPMEGQGAGSSAVATLSSSAVFDGVGKTWQVMDTTGDGKRYLTSVEVTKSGRIGGKNLEKKAAKGPVLIVTRHGEPVEEIERQAREKGLPVYYLAGGLEAYIEFLKTQAPMEAPVKVALQDVLPPVLRPASSGGSGCSGCPH